ncbi:DUF4280 domain-containing protein [Flavobacterium chilense]|uniref:DUF4280 domain-containing protein n=1 Tax=Flavobacterium chilense TaxID=946677 RepID=A0A1M6Z5J4_9FLAO|nr:DUF4280 domain-containing protein [Flavobacterium chilense]SHL25703.1 protein of unknown function [Flavobacterium chilense]
MAKPDNTLKRKEREEKEEAEDGLKFVIDGAKLKCDLCTVPAGDLKVNYDTPSTQDKRTATVVEKDKTSLVFKGNCKKSPQSSSPCASVMKLADWKDVGTVYFQDEFPLLLKSTIKCNYGGVDIKITDSAQRNEIEKIDTTGAPVPPQEEVDVDLIVEFELLSTYDGEFGFDWLKCDDSDNILKIQTDDISNLEYVFDDTKLEYISVVTVPDIKNKIKKDYKKTALNIPYYAYWLSLMQINQEIKLNMICKPVKTGEDITKGEISFMKNDFYEVVIDGQKNENIKYTPDGMPKEITIKCIKTSKQVDITPINKNKKEVGKIIAVDNTNIFDLSVRLVCVVKDTPNKEAEISKLISDFKTDKIEDYLNKNSLNQALIKTTIEVDNKYRIAFDETSWDGIFYNKTGNYFTNRKDPAGGKVSYIDDDGEEQKNVEYEHILDKFLREYKNTFETDGKKFRGILLFITNINKDSNDKEGGVSRTQPVNFREAIVFASNLTNKSTYAHEIAHALGLEHTFWSDVNDVTELTKNETYLNDLKNGIKSNENTKETNINAKKSNDENIKKNAAAKKSNEEAIRIRKLEIDKWTMEMKKPTYPYKKEAQVRIDDLKDQNKKTKAINDEIDEITKRNNKNNDDIKLYNEKIDKSLKRQKDNLNVYKNNKYKFIKKSTLNIMDYSSKINILTHWQWEIIQNDVKSYYGSTTENK